MKSTLAILAISSLGIISTAQASSCANVLCVPGDFPSPNGADFNMDLITGTVQLDFGTSNLQGGWNLNNLQPISFHASPFTNPNQTSVGFSTLTSLNIDHYTIGNFDIFGSTAEFYFSGSGSGTLTDIDGTKGDWSLTAPLEATSAGDTFDFGQVTFSTSASHSYYIYQKPPFQYPVPMATITGQSMDYATGNAFLVGQGSITDPDSSLYGLTVTFGLNANDPLVSTVPEPESYSLMFAGVIMLGLLVRRRQIYTAD